jgi:hypothetical protein
MIAIDHTNRLYYEGSANYGHGIWPSPVVSVATIIQSDDDRKTIPNGELAHAKMVFREDFFDPVTRIRRGRLYETTQIQPDNWYVQPHPAYPNETDARDHQGRLKKYLNGFRIWQVPENIRKHSTRVTIALGVMDAYTLWNVLSIERISTGEYLFTLRARASLGSLPELWLETVPEEGRRQIQERLEKVVEAAHRAGPESIVDRCKDAASAMLSLWLYAFYSENKARELDIGELVKLMQKHDELKQKHVIINAANILARLHARAKPNEEVRRGGRALTESDAECCMSLIGVLMREFGWTID